MVPDQSKLDNSLSGVAASDPSLLVREIELDDELLALPSTIAQTIQHRLVRNLLKDAPWVLEIYNIDECFSTNQ